MNWLTITDPKILKSSKLSFAKTRKFVKDDQVFQKVQVDIYWNMIWKPHRGIQWFKLHPLGSLKAPTFVGTPSVRSNRDVAMYGRQGKRCLKWCSPNDGNDGNVGQYGKRNDGLLWSFWVSRALLCRQGCWRPTSQEDATRYYVHLCALQATGEEDGTLVHRFWGESGVRKRKDEWMKM